MSKDEEMFKDEEMESVMGVMVCCPDSSFRTEVFAILIAESSESWLQDFLSRNCQLDTILF